MVTVLEKVVDLRQRYRGAKGRRKLANALVVHCDIMAVPKECRLGMHATAEEHRAAAKIGRAWHKQRRAIRQAQIEDLLAGKRSDLTPAERERLAEMVGLEREAGELLHEEHEDQKPTPRGGERRP